MAVSLAAGQAGTTPQGTRAPPVRRGVRGRHATRFCKEAPAPRPAPRRTACPRPFPPVRGPTSGDSSFHPETCGSAAGTSWASGVAHGNPRPQPRCLARLPPWMWILRRPFLAVVRLSLPVGIVSGGACARTIYCGRRAGALSSLGYKRSTSSACFRDSSDAKGTHDNTRTTRIHASRHRPPTLGVEAD